MGTALYLVFHVDGMIDSHVIFTVTCAACACHVVSGYAATNFSPAGCNKAAIIMLRFYTFLCRTWMTLLKPGLSPCCLNRSSWRFWRRA